MPSIRELGYPFVFDSPWGFAGPRGMDPAIVKVLHDTFKATLDDPGVQATMEKFEMAPRYLGSDAYTKFVGEQIVQERAFLDRLGMLKKE